MPSADLLLDTLPTFLVGQLGETSESIATWMQYFDQRFFASIAIVCLAAFVQATVGFAAALLGLPLLLWAGNDLMTSQVMVITAMMPQGTFKFYTRINQGLKSCLVKVLSRSVENC